MSYSGQWVRQTVNRVCFRGDRRAPAEGFKSLYHPDEIFSSGFGPKQLGDPVYGGSPGKVGDIRSGGVCVTTRFSVAPLFPLESNIPTTYIYAVWVETAWNTHAKQAYDAQKLLEDASGGNALVRFLTLGYFGNQNPVPQTQAKDLMWALFGDEIVTENIPSHNIIGAVCCERHLMRNDEQGIPKRITPKSLFKEGIDYTLHPPIVMNTQCTVPLPIYQSVLGFLSDELNMHRNGRTPPVEAGFVRNERK